MNKIKKRTLYVCTNCYTLLIFKNVNRIIILNKSLKFTDLVKFIGFCFGP